MLLAKEKVKQINSVTHEGKVVVVATDADGKIWYTVKQDGFEDSYLNTPADQRTGWESWEAVEFPDEAEDLSVVNKEKKECTDQKDSTVYLMRSLYKTKMLSAVAPVQLVSGMGFLYLFRQSTTHTLLVDRFVLDGMTNTLSRKLEVRFKRSRQKYKASESQKKGSTYLAHVDSLDFTDMAGNNFYEPTTELSLINPLANGWFSVVLSETSEQDKFRWHIFAYNKSSKKVELTTLRASEEGLFELKDYTVLDPNPRSIPGIIRRTIHLGSVQMANGLAATKYSVQKEQETQEEDDNGRKIKRLLRDSVRVMLVVGGDNGQAAAFSFGVAADGTLSQMDETTDHTTIRRSDNRQILLPIHTLDEVKAMATTHPPPHGTITGLARGEDDEVTITSAQSTELDETEITQIKLTETANYNGLYSKVVKIDQDTFEITPQSVNAGVWEVIPEEETGLVYDGCVTSYHITEEGKLRVSSFHHGLDTGDAVQLTNTKGYDGTYTVTKVDDTTFSLDDVKFQTGTTLGAKYLTQKRRGIFFDGKDDAIDLKITGAVLGSDFTIEVWVKPAKLAMGVKNVVLGTGADQGAYLMFNGQTLEFGMGGQRIESESSFLTLNTWYHVAVRYTAAGGTLDLFVNGVLDQSKAGYKAFAGTDPLKIGLWNNLYFDGCLSDVRVWEKARKAEDIHNNLHLQLQGVEVGLAGYWRLDAIVEGKDERTVIDFSVDGNNGMVRGGAYIGAIVLPRKVANLPAIQYENEELFAVAERSTYTEEFEFKTNVTVDPADADGHKNNLFCFAYKGKKNRSSEVWLPIQAGSTEFIALDGGWYKAQCHFTVPDGVSLVRSFGLDKVKGNTWLALEIRKHTIQVVSDSVTEANYTDDASKLTVLADGQQTLQEHIKTVVVKETQQGILLREQKTLNELLAALKSGQLASLIAAAQANIAAKQTEIATLTTEKATAQTTYDTELANPVNYWCKLVCREREDWLCRVYTRDRQLHHADTGSDGTLYSNIMFKFVPTDSGYYKLVTSWEDRPVGTSRSRSQIHGEDKSSSGHAYEWRPEKTGNYYFLYHRLTGEVMNRGGNGDYGVIVHPKHGGINQQWKLVKIDSYGASGTVISTALNHLNTKTWALQTANSELETLQAYLKTLQEGLAGVEYINRRLAAIQNQLDPVQTALNTANTAVINGVKTTGQTAQTMPTLKTDKRGLITQGAWLGFMRPASRLNAIETCEGHVQVSYFDDQRRMRQTNFDATSDSRNAAVEQWVPDAVRTCLNLNKETSVVTLDNAVPLGTDWTIEAWFAYPLPENDSGYNTLTAGKSADSQIVVKRTTAFSSAAASTATTYSADTSTGTSTELLGIYLTAGKQFISSGYDLSKKLRSGWHHLAAVGKGGTTLFYINGEKVGDMTVTVSASHVSSVGNDIQGKQPFGKVAEVRIWASALSADEVAVNSKTWLSGNEPGLLAYYPFNEAAGTLVRNQTGNSNYNGIAVGASWYACAALIGSVPGFLTVMQFGGEDWIDAGTRNLSGAAVSLSCWVKVDEFATAGGSETSIGIFKTSDAVREAPVSPLIGIEAPGNIALLRLGDSDHSDLSAKQVQFVLNLGSEQKITSATSLTKGTWYHLVGSYDGQKMKLFINGTEDASLEVTGTVTAAGTFHIAKGYNRRDSGARYLKGALAEVGIWTKGLTQAEIQAGMNKHLLGTEPGLAAYYPLDSVVISGKDRKVNELVASTQSIVTGALPVTDQALPIPLFPDAVVSSEYSAMDADKNAVMRRFFASPAEKGVTLYPHKRVEELEMKWIGNGQFAPTLLGYIEGAPPIPSENLTIEDNYAGATSVKLTTSNDVEYRWTRSQDSGLGASAEIFAGADVSADAGFGVTTQIAKVRSGLKGNLDLSYQFQNESSVSASSSLTSADSLTLVGNQEPVAAFSHLGKRFVPKNVGYALVVSALADVFITRLKRSGAMIGYQVLPVEGIPPDVNTITFMINPTYTMGGSLDGLTGSSATSQRFFKHVPAMRAQFGSLYPASYYRLEEAYTLKEKIEKQDKARAAYFAQFNSRLLDENSMENQVSQGAAPDTLTVDRSEDAGSDDQTDAEKKAAAKEQEKKLTSETKAAKEKQSAAVTKKQSEIQTKLSEGEERNQATSSFASWQKKMEDIQIRAGKRNIVNTYVWDADGGLRSEEQSFSSTNEHSIGGSFSLNAGLGYEGNFAATGVAVELTAQATVNLTQTMSKTEVHSKGLSLEVDLSGVEGRGVTDYKDLPILPGEKVNRYRFMTFYLEGSTNNFNDFFQYVVDPEWLAGNSEEARALRQAKGKANKAWRVLHRVTYVERPALAGFGRDVRQLPPADEATELGQLKATTDELKQQTAEMQRKLDTLLARLPAATKA